MSGSTRRKLRSQVVCERTLGDASEDTSARTRPLSYDDIMLKRKTKNECKGLEGEAREVETTKREEIVRTPDRQRRNTNGAAVKNSRDYPREASPRKKVEKSSRKEHTLNKSEIKERRDAESRSKHKDDNDSRKAIESKDDRQGHMRNKADEHSRGDAKHNHYKSEIKERRDAESRSKHKDDNDSRNAIESKDDRQGHMRSKAEEHSRGDAKHNHENKHHKDSVAQDRHIERNRGASERDNRSVDDEKYRMRDTGKIAGASERESKRKDRSVDAENYRMRDTGKVIGTSERESKRKDQFGDDEKYRMRDTGKIAGASERESKRKDRSGDDEKYRIRDTGKKHDSGSRRDSEFSERKEKTELSLSHHDETRSKRRRSRSQERTQDKTRRSSSSSPKAQKNALDHVHEKSELSSRSERDRSRCHSDVDRSKMSSDGSSNHHRRHGGSSSGLGGYSPRKRKSEAAVKTPSPIRSPERKSAGWDLPPSGGDKIPSTAIPSGTQLASQSKPSNMMELAASFSVASSMGKPISAILSTSLSAFKQATIDSVQLTQATRPMRRLYIDNIPGSATEKDIMECFNTFLLSAGSNHIRGTHPCISCMINKEKAQALVEFLSPEDASAALSFDGRSFSGSILRIRRPKDFVEVPSGSAEKLKAGSDSIGEVTISGFVEDSPQKIFVGGIAEGLFSETILEIVSAFGTLKAFRFEVNEEFKEPCAFLEYADHSVTLKACAGLNGMKLGGRILTVAQAVPNSESVEGSGSHPFYGIPEHVKPLLKTPTQVLKLNSVLDQKAMDSLSETELEEIIEDVRLECSRFGAVMSINIVKGGNTHTAFSETKDITDDMKHIQPPQESVHHLNVNPIDVAVDHDGGDGRNGEPMANFNELNPVDGVEGDKHELSPATTNPGIEAGAAGTRTVEESKEADKTLPQNYDDKADNDEAEAALIGLSTIDDTGNVNEFEEIHRAASIEERESSVLNTNGSMDVEKSGDGETFCAEDVSEVDNNNNTLEEVVPLPTNSGGTEETGLHNNSSCELDSMFEVGCVLVEFRRAEASCMAAHCMHGRAFDDRIVTVEYIPLQAYRERFPK